MFMDFMDFTDDACMNMFTQGQKNEMRSLFALGNFRNSFLNSSVCDSSLAQGGPLPTDSVTTSNNIVISVYPNPFSNQLTISGKNESDITGKTVKLYDVTGRLYISKAITSQKTTMNVGNLPSGMYILKVEGGNSPQVFKLIKQNNTSL